MMEPYAKKISSGLYGFGVLCFYDIGNYPGDGDMEIALMMITVINKDGNTKYRTRVLNPRKGFDFKSPYLAHMKWYQKVDDKTYDNCIFINEENQRVSVAFEEGDTIIINFSKFICDRYYPAIGFEILD